jgi:hypothetical protein
VPTAIEPEEVIVPYPVGACRWGRPRKFARLVNEPRSIPSTKEDTTSPHTAPRAEPQVVDSRRSESRGRADLCCRLAAGIAGALVLAVALATPASAAATATSLTSLISNLTGWLVGLLAGVATLFLTLGGLRYLTANGDPGQVEKAKTALKSAAIGYALAALAPLLVSILASLVS